MTPSFDLEAVHLDQQLVERLLALVVAAAEAGTTMPADGVDLVDEDDAGGVLLALLEQVAHPGGADADEHLDEVRAGDREERDVGLAGDRPGQQGLAGSGRAYQQHALGDLAALHTPRKSSSGAHMISSEKKPLSRGFSAFTSTPCARRVSISFSSFRM